MKLECEKKKVPKLLKWDFFYNFIIKIMNLS